MGVGKQGGNSKCWIDLGRRESDRYLRDRSWKCPVGSVECPESTLRSTSQQRRRINRSMTLEAPDSKIETHKYKDPVGVRFPVVIHLLVLFRRHFHIH